MSLIKVKNFKKQFQIGSETVNAIKDISFEVMKENLFRLWGRQVLGQTPYEYHRLS